ncbi:putative adenine phosphoribosyltransferase [Corynebacterium efficiens YS-314]|uniref:Adenine phosphoribosyltransferase n=1 Tax=Corynebacterium efficiens (strain DSM 44549 / YS-314 / AJ 12310 / JCM 11189 / NBRC 100395) TaxID=196164 RepID=APT_COREF|nr:adenine phosphoribosyltransferase [Corynebacterium efficiens]Q8FPL0.2 RecName: Full=Adenine phosphoribosyltransferase; Short=APRT [Corynebacterium efficiens YS-314]EEW49558.1 putative adenine phosphoribosyltransferase [Corynebacterium efficiens YS-314]
MDSGRDSGNDSGSVNMARARVALTEHTRYVHDFPAEGVLFEDLTPVLANAEAFAAVVDAQAEAAEELGAEIIGGLDARGFLLGSAVAYKLGLGVIAIRKKGKLPPPVVTQDYDLEYGSAALELPAEGLDLEGRRVVLIDDVLATGGTLAAARKLIETCGGNVTGYVLAIEVGGLGGRERLGDIPVHVIRDPQ